MRNFVPQSAKSPAMSDYAGLRPSGSGGVGPTSRDARVRRERRRIAQRKRRRTRELVQRPRERNAQPTRKVGVSPKVVAICLD